LDTHGFDISALLSPPDVLSAKKVLCIQPHPDDNEIGMGGIIAVLAKNGCEIHYLTVTNGDQGCPTLSKEKAAAVRHEETIAAGKHLGAAHFHFLDHGDGTLSAAYPLSLEIISVIRKVQPDVIFCPDPWLNYECHYDHIITGKAAAAAFCASGRRYFEDGGETSPWNASAIGFYFTAKPNTVIDISETFEQKFEAIKLHKSQISAETEAMYRVYFGMKAQELAQDKDFSLGEGLKVLSPLHTHCFVDADKI